MPINNVLERYLLIIINNLSNKIINSNIFSILINFLWLINLYISLDTIVMPKIHIFFFLTQYRCVLFYIYGIDLRIEF